MSGDRQKAIFLRVVLKMPCKLIFTAQIENLQRAFRKMDVVKKIQDDLNCDDVKSVKSMLQNL